MNLTYRPSSLLASKEKIEHARTVIAGYDRTLPDNELAGDVCHAASEQGRYIVADEAAGEGR